MAFYAPRIITGSGDQLSVAGAATEGQWVKLQKGTSASPDTSLDPLLKSERTIEVSRAAITSDGAEQLAAISGIVRGTAGCEVQPVGVFGGAKTASTTGLAAADACGVYGRALVESGAAGDAAIGAFFAAVSDSSTGRVVGNETAIRRTAGLDHSYNSGGVGDSVGLVLHTTGSLRSDSAIKIRKTSAGSQFDVGLGVTSENPILSATFRDDGNAAKSLVINGSHADGAIVVADGAGPVVVGGPSVISAASLLDVQHSGAADPLVNFGASISSAMTVRLRNSVGNVAWFVSGGANNFLTGTAAGDTGFNIRTTGKKLHIGGTSSALAVTRENEIGFFGVTPVAQGAANADTSGATFVQLEAEVNEIKQTLRDFGLIAV